MPKKKTTTQKKNTLKKKSIIKKPKLKSMMGFQLKFNPIILIEISIDKKAQSLINSWGYKTIWKKERNTWNIREN